MPRKPTQHVPKGAYAHTADPDYAQVRDAMARRLKTAMTLFMDRFELSQADLAKMMGLSESAVKHRLIGRTPFSVAELAGLAAAHEVPVAVFFDLRVAFASMFPDG